MRDRTADLASPVFQNGAILMITRRPIRPQLFVEELESRFVLSAASSLHGPASFALQNFVAAPPGGSRSVRRPAFPGCELNSTRKHKLVGLCRCHKQCYFCQRHLDSAHG